MAGNITVEELDLGNQEEWDEFVEGSNNGTIFHTQKFLDYHPDDRFDERPLLFHYKGENLLAVMPLAVSEEDGEHIARSPYGASYGGLVVEERLNFRYTNRIIQALIGYLKKEDIDRIRIRQPPRPQSKTSSCYISYHLIDSGFNIIDREVNNVLDLTAIDKNNNLFDVYESRCRRAIRNGQNSTFKVTRSSDRVEEFYSVLETTLEQYNAEPTHTLDELKWLLDQFPEKITLHVAVQDDLVIAGIVQFILNNRVNLQFYNAHREEFRSEDPLSLLFHQEIKHTQQEGIEYFDFGNSVKNHDPQNNLIMFKESFGSVGQFRNVYCREFK